MIDLLRRVIMTIILFCGLWSFCPFVDAAIAFRADVTDASGDGTLPQPTGAAEGDLLIAQIIHSTATVTGLTGWTELEESTVNNSVVLSTFYIIRGAGDPDLTYVACGTDYSEYMIAYTGTHQTTPVGTFAVQYNTTSTTPDSPSIDLIDSASWLYVFGDIVDTGTYTVPTGMTVRESTTNINGAADLATPADPTGIKEWTLSGAGSDSHNTSLEIRPPAAAARRVLILSDLQEP